MLQIVKEIFKENILIYVILGLCALSLLIKMLVSFAYKRLMKSSSQMNTSKNKLMKLIRLKFETCYKLKIGVNNVDAFVDKYVYKYRFCGILLYTWENLSGQLLILCLLTGTVGSVFGLIYDCGKVAILSTFFTGIFTAALLITFENMLNLNVKKNIIRVNIKDYLENYLKAKLENEFLTPELLEQYRNEYFTTKNPDKELKDMEQEKTVSMETGENEEDMRELVESLTAAVNEKMEKEIESKKAMKKNTKQYQINKKDEKIIEEVLREYLA
jgi:hypothetical protein